MEAIYKKILNKMDNSEIISAIRRGLIMIIPVLMMGSFALILKSMPINAYQHFINHAFAGAFLSMFNFVYDATFGLLSVYIAFSISIYFIRSLGAKNNYAFVGGITTVASFFILSGVNSKEFNIGPLGPKGMFTAIFCGIIVSKLFMIVINNLKIPFRLYADGIDLEFNDSIIAMIPAISIVALFAIFNYLICNVFEMDSFHDFYVYIVGLIFRGRKASFLNGFLFVVTSSILWFMGIHGSDVLESVSDKIFSPGINKNIDLLTSGRQPTEILTRQFFDQFVLLGGCGVTI